MEHPSCIFRFADVEVDERNFSVTKAGEVLPLEPKVFKVLQFLLHHPNRVVTKDELLDAVWSDTSVSESSLTRSVATLRRLLGDDIREPRYIATVPTVGYRFLCEVQVSENGFAPASASDTMAESPAQQPPPTPQPASPTEEPKTHPKRSLAAFAACCALVLLPAAGWFLYTKLRANNPPPVQRALTRLTSDDGLQSGATWSPDGRFIAYASDRGGKYDIWIQQISGGDPIQVTKSPGQNWQPDWSPDGKYIAYRSEDGGGGIYIIPALGGAGQQRKITPAGYFPRWSPDSSRILLQSATGQEWKKVYVVVGLDGGPPREVLTETEKRHQVFSAVWHPDGKRITAWTFDGGAFPLSPSAIPNFSTEPVDGGPATESRFPPELRKQFDDAGAGPGIPEWRLDVKFAWAPSGKAIYLERSLRGARNVWRMTVDPITLQPTKIERLTTSPGLDTDLSISPDGSKLAFTSERQPIRAWIFPFDANHGRMTGPGEPVTSAGIEVWQLNLSRDGKKLAIWGIRDGKVGPWEISVPNGREEPFVAADSYFRQPPIWSPDGKRAAYLRFSSGKKQIVVWSPENRNEDPVGTETSKQLFLYDWSPDGKSVLVSQANGPEERWEIGQLSIDPSISWESSARRIAADPNHSLWQPHISRDGRWIVFEATTDLLDRSTIYVIPASGGEWVQITDGKQLDDKPRWSPDGKTVYFLSGRRGFFNLWGVHFDPVKGRPEGEPFQVTSFETPTLMIPKPIDLVDISLTDRCLVLPLAQTSGNIWILDNVDR
jgi:Tol biopolymer transport system component/DNA-binding winged helix-turn-helix (wHTH) protein